MDNYFEPHKLDECDVLLRQQKLNMPSSPLRLTRLAGIDIIDHLMLLDCLAEGELMGDELRKKCRVRFERFCEIQWLNKN